MEKYKSSIYNNIFNFDDNWVIFNSLSGAILKTKNQENIIKIESGKIMELPEYIIDMLCQKGIILEHEVDEIKRGTIKNYNNMFSNHLNIVIMPTEQCNFRCEYCYEDYQNGAMTKDTQNNFLKWFKKNIKKYESVTIEWFGGEPLLNVDIIEYLSKNMIEICHKWGIRYSAAMTTNGYLLTASLLRQLLQYRVTGYQITIDGLAVQHDKLRHLKDGTGSFNIIMKNLCEIKREIKTTAIHIVIRGNLLKDTIYVDKYLQYMSDCFGGDRRFCFYFRPVGNWGGTQVEKIQDNLLNVQNMSDIYTHIANHNYRLSFTPYWQALVDGTCCVGRKNSFVLRSTGKICKCTMRLEIEKNNLGYIDQNGDMILDQFKIDKWLKIEEPVKCTECSKRGSCFGRGCPAQENIVVNSNLCGYEHRDMKNILRLLIKSNTITPITW